MKVLAVVLDGEYVTLTIKEELDSRIRKQILIHFKYMSNHIFYRMVPGKVVVTLEAWQASFDH